MDMKQIVAVLGRVSRYAAVFARDVAFWLVAVALLEGLGRALRGWLVWSWLMPSTVSGPRVADPLTSPLSWLSALIVWFATAWMAYLVVGWLQRTLSGNRPAPAAAVGAALGAGLLLLAVQLVLGLVLWLAPFPSAGGVYLVYPVGGLVALALLLPAMVYAAVRAQGFRDALGRLGEALTRPGYGRLLIRPGYWAAFAALALWLLASSWLGRVGLQLDLDRALEPQFYGFLFSEVLRGFLTTVIGLPIVAAVLRSVYDAVWGSPEAASATPAPPAA